jgi:DHA1 family inner membrane transport protein
LTEGFARPTAGSVRGFNWPLLALAIGAFGIGVTEFTPMGLLPIIAHGVHVSIPTAGMLITAYAVGVMAGAPIMTLALSRLRKRTALILLMGIFTLGNVLSAIAPSYGFLLVARLITSMNHGAFFGLGAVVAGRLVRPEKSVQAVSTMFMGLTIANVGGVPAATWLGQQIGWRMAFGATALLGLVAIASLLLALPQGERGEKPQLLRELSVLTRPAVLRAMGTTVMGSGAMFALYTYVAPTLTTLTHASGGFVTLCLVLIGVGFTLGNVLGGRLADWSLDGSVKIFMAVMAIIMVALPFAMMTHLGAAIGLLLWGVATFAIIPAIQARVMKAAAEAPALASSINIGAFNLGNALGAAVGAGILSLGLGYASVPIAGAVLAVIGLGLVFLGGRTSRQRECASEA